MIDYSKWKESQFTVTNLLLDPNNPRIPSSGNEVTQRDLLADLVEHDKVIELAKLIVENGYYPVESLIIVKENSKKIVIEGNRRLAALKLLISPEAAPNDRWISRFRTLSNQINAQLIKKVKVIVAPSREAAAPMIMSKHTRRQIAGWLPIMQAKFYYNLVKQGVTAEDIAQQYSLPITEVNEALRRHTMYSIACKLDLEKGVEEVVTNPRTFPITTLERFFEAPSVAKLLGISFDENLKLIGSVKVDEFIKGYTKLVTEVAKKNEVNSRKVNTVDSMKNYINSFGSNKPNLKRKGKFTAETILDKKHNKAKKGNTDNTKKKQKRKTNPRSVIDNSLTCAINNKRINDVFKELKKLPVAQYPNSTGIMFRSLIEMSLSYYLDRSGHITEIVKEEKAKRRKANNNLPKGWHPSLNQMLKYIVRDDIDIIKNGNLIKSLKKLISEKNKLISIDTLHLFVHNQYVYPKEDTLRELSSQLQGLLEVILEEPPDDIKI